MIKSMTGFGISNLSNNSREYQVEIKSVNHKYNDVTIKLPRNLSYLEEAVKKVITSKIKRGKIDVFVTYENYGDLGKEVIINKEIAKIYIKNLKELAEEENLASNIEVTDITRLPDVLQLKNNQNDEQIEKELIDATNEAVDKLIQMRRTEGEKICQDLVIRIENIKTKVEEIAGLSTNIIEEYIEKLENRIKEILKTEDVDKSRLAQEIVIYADKCSVEEELTRLNSHISQLTELIKSDEAVGKKIDFIIQEMNRETNTIGSKSGNIEISNRVVDIKTELEDIREQIQNIE